MPQIGVQPTFEEQQRAALARIRSGALDGATTRDNELGFSAPLLYATALFMTAGVAVTMRRETKPAVVRHTIRTSPTPRSKLRRRR
jgi:hypothetical protein